MNKQKDHREIAEAIETLRLLLRRPHSRDNVSLKNLFCNEQVKRYLGDAISPQAATERVSRIFSVWEDSQDELLGEWVICEKGSDEPIGICSLGWFETEIEVSYILIPTMWGKGYASEAAHACLTYGFQELQLDLIIGVTQEANRNSQHVLEKLGMHHTRNLWKWGAPQRLYELTRTEWFFRQRFILF